MTTKLIGIKQYRENITMLWKEAREKNIRYIVMYHSTPIFEVNPLTEENITLEQLVTDVQEARQQVKRKEVYTPEEVYKKLGL
ncbi:MAG: hypothetical protein Q8P27_02895 [Candidatus Peregrinibacteria bacterium]|nr:hypothetical protein [Candidatus Peregrinibacteria bacterium]